MATSMGLLLDICQSQSGVVYAIFVPLSRLVICSLFLFAGCTDKGEVATRNRAATLEKTIYADTFVGRDDALRFIHSKKGEPWLVEVKSLDELLSFSPRTASSHELEGIHLRSKLPVLDYPFANEHYYTAPIFNVSQKDSTILRLLPKQYDGRNCIALNVREEIICAVYLNQVDRSMTFVWNKAKQAPYSVTRDVLFESDGVGWRSFDSLLECKVVSDYCIVLDGYHRRLWYLMNDGSSCEVEIRPQNESFVRSGLMDVKSSYLYVVTSNELFSRVITSGSAETRPIYARLEKFPLSPREAAVESSGAGSVFLLEWGKYSCGILDDKLILGIDDGSDKWIQLDLEVR